MLDRREDVARVGEEATPLGPELHAAGAAIEEGHAELVLERANLATQRRL